MAVTISSLGLDKLSREERLALVQELWDSIAAEPAACRLTDAQKEELLRRADEADTHPETGVPWEEVKAKARTRFKS